MELSRQFKLIAQKLMDENSDIRHTLLDVWPLFEQITRQVNGFPDYLHDEVKQLRTELKSVQPQFPSHRKTSVLFDQEGMGKKGFAQANEIARRIISVYRRLEKAG